MKGIPIEKRALALAILPALFFPQIFAQSPKAGYDLNGRWEVDGVGPVTIRQTNDRVEVTATGSKVRTTWTDGEGSFTEKDRIEVRFTKFRQPAKIDRVPIRQHLVGTIRDGGKTISWEREKWPDWKSLNPEPSSSSSALSPSSAKRSERFRTFTARDGRTFRGALVSFEGEKIKVVRKDLKRFLVPIANLSETDKAFLREKLEQLETIRRAEETISEKQEKTYRKLTDAFKANYMGRLHIKLNRSIQSVSEIDKKESMEKGLKAADELYSFLKSEVPDSLLCADAALESAILARRQGPNREWTSNETGWQRAERLFEEAYQIYRTKLGDFSPKTINCLHRLSQLHGELGRIHREERHDLKAEETYLKMATAHQIIGGEKAGDKGKRLTEFARVSLRLEKHERARDAANEAYEIFTREPTQDRSLIQLSEVFEKLRDFSKAQTILQLSLEATIERWGEDGLNTGNCWNKLAYLHRAMGDEEKAIECFEKALEIFKIRNTTNAWGVAQGWGDILESKGDDHEAQKLYETVLEIFDSSTRSSEYTERNLLKRLAGVCRNQGNLSRAEMYYQRAVNLMNGGGAVHADFASLLYLMNRRDEIAPLVDKYLSGHYGHLGFRLSSSSEQERLRVRGEENPVAKVAQFAPAEAVAEAVLRTKGIVLESLIEDRLHLLQEKNNPEVSDLYRNRKRLKRAYQEAYLQSRKDPKKSDELETLESQITSVEKDLAKVAKKNLGGSRSALKISLPEVSSRLPVGFALVEFIVQIDWKSARDQEVNYGAVVIRPDAPPAVVKCDSRKVIDEEISHFLTIAENFGPNEVMHASIRKLYDALIQPLLSHLEGVDTLVISPESQLNFVPFASLLSPEDQFLTETHTIYFVASGRDLLARPPGQRESDFALVVAAPEFRFNHNKPVPETNESLNQTLRAGLGNDVRGMNLAALPGTMEEASRIKTVLDGALVKKTHLLTGKAASEKELRNLTTPPKFLHLATHGFYLPEITTPASASLDEIEPAGNSAPAIPVQNPMYRSGIALTGAQDTFDRWEKGDVPQTWEDGILMAAEVSELNLQGTELVTLSACSSAVGKAVDGEGIMGLRRGFAMAGASNVLMTLWPIDDRDTVRFMEDFYQKYSIHRNAPKALHEVQREWLVRLRAEEGLTHSINRAGVFVMSARATQ